MAIVKVTVIKSFPYGHDGVHIEQLAVNAQVDIHDDLIPGLVKEGFIADPKAKPPREKLSLPLGDDKTAAKQPRSRSAG